MNKLQEKLLDILKVYLEICDKLGLTYYLANGSALGAEKYGGFIPWDDDMDVVMPREDYEIFCEKAPTYLPTHMFLQNYKSDPSFPHFYSKLRDSNTAFVEKGVEHLDMNHGMFIDIFPLDGYPKCRISQKWLACKLRVMRVKQFCGFSVSQKLHHKVLRLLGYHKRTAKTLKKMEKTVRKFGTQTEYCCDYGDRQGKGCLPRSYYGEGRTVFFEGVKVLIPLQIDAYLTYKYGDWRADLPTEQKKSHHNVLFCDTEKSYTHYQNNL